MNEIEGWLRLVLGFGAEQEPKVVEVSVAEGVQKVRIEIGG
jgi:hypothetical protein